MMKRATNSSIISLVATISTVFGCGVTPVGQVSTRNFTVSGFTLPVAMAYSEAVDVLAQVPGIAANAAGATEFVRRLVMQTVIDVLESQARSALLPDAIISSILSQLEVKVAYVPMNCQKVVFNLMDNQEAMIDKCIIVDSTVTGICPKQGAAQAGMRCDQVMLGAVSETHLRISGTLSTSNIIMANWSRTMWQSVVNRAIRMLTLGPFGLNFFPISATVGGSRI